MNKPKIFQILEGMALAHVVFNLIHVPDILDVPTLSNLSDSI